MLKLVQPLLLFHEWSQISQNQYVPIPITPDLKLLITLHNKTLVANISYISMALMMSARLCLTWLLGYLRCLSNKIGYCRGRDRGSHWSTICFWMQKICGAQVPFEFQNVLQWWQNKIVLVLPHRSAGTDGATSPRWWMILGLHRLHSVLPEWSQWCSNSILSIPAEWMVPQICLTSCQKLLNFGQSKRNVFNRLTTDVWRGFREQKVILSRDGSYRSIRSLPPCRECFRTDWTKVVTEKNSYFHIRCKMWNRKWTTGSVDVLCYTIQTVTYNCLIISGKVPERRILWVRTTE